MFAEEVGEAKAIISADFLSISSKVQLVVNLMLTVSAI